ncbi:carbohydrate kinase family protein [Candidatus Daviesbacteria bacterium]|nr:carbohydrate kinase family protein [Candidatus Daviesbacteria bacterium]
MFDLISIGDCVIDTFIPLNDAGVVEKDGVQLLTLRYGDKIPVEPSVSMVAGNAANNAVGASRLGLKTAIYTNVGNKDDDEADDRIIARFKKEKIDTRYVIENANMFSNHHIVLNYKGERTILIYHQPWKFDLPDLDKSKWVYLTSMSPSYVESSVVEQIIHYLERSSSKLAYQPGTFQLKVGAKKSARLLSLTEIFFVNLEEAKLFLGFEKGEDISIKKLLKGLLDLGPKMVVITDGGKGSFGFDGENYYKLDIFPARILEMTGAGDAYATGCMAGLFYGNDLPEAMRWGAANGASVVEQVGPQAGLLTYHKMLEKLKESSKIVAREI